MVKLSPFAIVIRLVAFLMLGMGARELSAATFVKADFTTLLGPSFFIDDPVIGGTTDVVVHQPGSGTYVRSFFRPADGESGLDHADDHGAGLRLELHHDDHLPWCRWRGGSIRVPPGWTIS